MKLQDLPYELVCMIINHCATDIEACELYEIYTGGKSVGIEFSDELFTIAGSCDIDLRIPIIRISETYTDECNCGTFSLDHRFSKCCYDWDSLCLQTLEPFMDKLRVWVKNATIYDQWYTRYRLVNFLVKFEWFAEYVHKFVEVEFKRQFPRPDLLAAEQDFNNFEVYAQEYDLGVLAEHLKSKIDQLDHDFEKIYRSYNNWGNARQIKRVNMLRVCKKLQYILDNIIY